MRSRWRSGPEEVPSCRPAGPASCICRVPHPRRTCPKGLRNSPVPEAALWLVLPPFSGPPSAEPVTGQRACRHRTASRDSTVLHSASSGYIVPLAERNWTALGLDGSGPDYRIWSWPRAYESLFSPRSSAPSPSRHCGGADPAPAYHLRGPPSPVDFSGTAMHARVRVTPKSTTMQ